MPRGLSGDDLREFYRLVGPWLKPRQMTRGEELPLSRDNRIVVRPIRESDTAALFAALSKVFLARHFAPYTHGSVQATLNQRELKRALRDIKFPTEVFRIVPRGQERPGDVVLQRVCAPGYGRRVDGVNCGRPFLLLEDGSWVSTPPTQINVTVPVIAIPSRNPGFLFDHDQILRDRHSPNALFVHNAQDIARRIRAGTLTADDVYVTEFDQFLLAFEPDEFYVGTDEHVRIADCEERALERLIIPDAPWHDPFFSASDSAVSDAITLCARLHDRLEQLRTDLGGIPELADALDAYFDILGIGRSACRRFEWLWREFYEAREEMIRDTFEDEEETGSPRKRQKIKRRKSPPPLSPELQARIRQVKARQQR